MRINSQATAALMTVIICTMALGCATGNGAKAYSIVRQAAGEGTLLDVNAKTLRMLDRFQYEIVRTENSGQMAFYQTNWKYRIPFDDERAVGIVQARTRLTIRARPRRVATTAGSSNLYMVRMEAENMVMFEDSEIWTVTPNTSEYVQYVRTLAKDLENELRMTLSKF